MISWKNTIAIIISIHEKESTPRGLWSKVKECLKWQRVQLQSSLGNTITNRYPKCRMHRHLSRAGLAALNSKSFRNNKLTYLPGQTNIVS